MFLSAKSPKFLYKYVTDAVTTKLLWNKMIKYEAILFVSHILQFDHSPLSSKVRPPSKARGFHRTIGLVKLVINSMGIMFLSKNSQICKKHTNAKKHRRWQFLHILSFFPALVVLFFFTQSCIHIIFCMYFYTKNNMAH